MDDSRDDCSNTHDHLTLEDQEPAQPQSKTEEPQPHQQPEQQPGQQVPTDNAHGRMAPDDNDISSEGPSSLPRHLPIVIMAANVTTAVASDPRSFEKQWATTASTTQIVMQSESGGLPALKASRT